MARAAFNVISLSERAAERIRDIMANSDDDVIGLRLGVKNAGCAGMSYTMDYVKDADPGDDVVEDKGVTVYVDPKAVLFLLGTEMDFEVSQFSSGFVFNNPNQVGACGCGESVSLKPADMKLLEPKDDAPASH